MDNLISRFVIFKSETVFQDRPEKQDTLINPAGGFTIPPGILEGAGVSLKKLTKQLVVELEKEVILRSLQLHGGNRKKTAHALKISYRALLYKIRDAGLLPRRGMAAPTARVQEIPRVQDVPRMQDEEEGELPSAAGIRK